MPIQYPAQRNRPGNIKQQFAGLVRFIETRNGKTYLVLNDNTELDITDFLNGTSSGGFLVPNHDITESDIGKLAMGTLVEGEIKATVAQTTQLQLVKLFAGILYGPIVGISGDNVIIGDTSEGLMRVILSEDGNGFSAPGTYDEGDYLLAWDDGKVVSYSDWLTLSSNNEDLSIEVFEELKNRLAVNGGLFVCGEVASAGDTVVARQMLKPYKDTDGISTTNIQLSALEETTETENTQIISANVSGFAEGLYWGVLRVQDLDGNGDPTGDPYIAALCNAIPVNPDPELEDIHGIANEASILAHSSALQVPIVFKYKMAPMYAQVVELGDWDWNFLNTGPDYGIPIGTEVLVLPNDTYVSEFWFEIVEQFAGGIAESGDPAWLLEFDDFQYLYPFNILKTLVAGQKGVIDTKSFLHINLSEFYTVQNSPVSITCQFLPNAGADPALTAGRIKVYAVIKPLPFLNTTP